MSLGKGEQGRSSLVRLATVALPLQEGHKRDSWEYKAAR